MREHQTRFKALAAVSLLAIIACVAGGALFLYNQNDHDDYIVTTTVTRPLHMMGKGGAALGEAEFTSEGGYYTIARNDSNIIVYDASRLDDIFDEAASDVSLDDLDVAIDGNTDLPADFKPLAHDYCAALVGHYPDADLRVLLHNLRQLKVVYETEDDIKEETDQRSAVGYFSAGSHKIVMPQGLDCSAAGWGRQVVYHELAHATRLYYGYRGDGVDALVRFSGPDDQTGALSEALTSLLAVSLMDQEPEAISYQRYCNYANVIMASLGDYDLGDYLDHSSQWLTRKLDERFGGEGGQLLLELMQLQRDDLSDGHANAPTPSADLLYDKLADLYFANRVSGVSCYRDAKVVADELVSMLSQGLDDAEDAVDADRIYHDLREQCRSLGMKDVPSEEPQEQTTEGNHDDATTGEGDDVPQGVSYLASFTERPQVTYQVLAYGSEGGDTRPGKYSDEASSRNSPLAYEMRVGGGQYLALYAGGTCRLFETSDNETADVRMGYWDADDDGDLRNFTLSDAYYDGGVCQDGDGCMIAMGSSKVTMLCVPSGYDVRRLKPYHTALRTRTEGYEEHNAFEGGWSYQSLELASWVEEDLAFEEQHYGGEHLAAQEYLDELRSAAASVPTLSDSLDRTIADGGYQRIYIDGAGMWRMASDGTLSRKVLEGRFEVSSLTKASCEKRSVDDRNPLTSDAEFSPTFELTGAGTLVEHRGCVDITYRRDDGVRDPRNDEDTLGGLATVGILKLPDRLAAVGR